MLIALLMAVMTANARIPEISVFDARDDDKYIWVLVDDCPVRIEKKNIKNVDYIDLMIRKICGPNLPWEDED